MKLSQNARIVLYGTMTLFFWFALYAFVPYLSTYAYSMTSNTALIGMMLGAYGWAQILFRVPIGVISDRHNNRRFFIQTGCALLLVSTLGFYFSNNVYWLILFRAVSGISAAVWVVMSVLFGGYFAPEYRVKALTILNACNLFGQMIASLIAIPVTAKYGISSTFLIAAAGGLIALLISFTLKEKKFDRKPLSLKNLLAVGRSKWVLMISAMCILSQLMFFATTSGFTPQLALALGSAPSTLGWIQLISTAGGAAFSFLSPRLFVDRFGALNTVVVLLALQAVSCLIQPLAGTLNLLLLIIFINGIARGTAVSLMLGLITMPFPYEKQAAAMGFYQAFYALGITLGPTIAGAAMEIGGLARGFYVVGSLGLIAPVIGIFLIREKNALLEAAE